MRCDDQLTIAKNICATLKTDKNETVRHMVKDCTINDWNRECTSFDAIIDLPVKKVIGKYYPINKKKWNLRSLTAGIKRAVKPHYAMINYIEHPPPTYQYSYGQKSFDGYVKDHTIFDVDL